MGGTGKEYYYNDETGESTWRRPRITLSKGSDNMQLNHSYNSTHYSSPSKSLPEASEITHANYGDDFSVGDSSARTDDSKNMCFHVEPHNSDVDIYKVSGFSTIKSHFSIVNKII